MHILKTAEENVLLSSIEVECENVLSSSIEMECENVPTEEFDDLEEMSFDDIGTLQEDALEYISGYIIRKLKLEEYECHEISYTWIDQISKGHLKNHQWNSLKT